MTKVEAIIEVLKDSGGAAPLSYIYNHIESYYPGAKKAKDWKSGVRGVLLRELYQNRYFKRIDTGVYSLLGYENGEAIEGERETKVDKKQILQAARLFKTTHESHKVKVGEQKVRIENRKQKERVAILEDYSCQLCGWSLEWKDKKDKTKYRIDIDHIVPKEDKGGEEISNLWALCPNCHTEKTLGVITVDLINKRILKRGTPVDLHHNFHLWLTS